MAGCGGFRSMANPKFIVSILVFFITIHLIFYKLRQSNVSLFRDQPVKRTDSAGKGSKSSIFPRGNFGTLPVKKINNKTVTKSHESRRTATDNVLKSKGQNTLHYNAGDIPKVLDVLKTMRDKDKDPSRPTNLAECKPSKLGPIKSIVTDFSKIPDNFHENFPEVHGGLWQPSQCKPLHRTALIIPYRNRTNNLKVFLNHMHKVLQSQLLDYGIFVVEQADKKLFNRAKLINIGYVEAQKFHSYDCFIIHDIDKIPEDTRNIYRCDTKPKHMISQRRTIKNHEYKPGMLYFWYFGGATSISYTHFYQINGMSNMFWGWGREDDDFASRMTYSWYFGGVVAIQHSHFSNVNGMSNLYWGWGREDDDLAARVRVRGLGGIFSRGVEGRYLILDHGNDRVENKMKWPFMNIVRQRMMTDGLSTLNYTITGVQVEPLYTKISVLL